MIDNFIKYLRDLKGYSENTIRAYESDLRTFATWAKAQETPLRWSTITRQDIDNYISMLVLSGHKATSTNRALAAISSLYRYFQREGMLHENPCKYESRRKQGERIPNTIPTGDLRQAYANAQGTAKLMIGILATTGMRISELCSLRWQDINFQEGIAKISGKGNKQRLAYLPQEQLRQLQLYTTNSNRVGYIFGLTQRDSRYILYHALKPYSRAAQLSPHAIRHTYATELAKHGANVATIATLLGHTDIRTTQKYIDMAQIAPKNQSINLNPIN